MATISGTTGRVNTGDAVANTKSWSLDVPSTELDASTFGISWELTDSGIKEWSGSFEASYESGTSTQTDLWNAFIAGSTLEIDFLMDPANYYTGEIKITSISPSQSHNELGKLTVAFKGTGALSQIQV
jgi:hypothetical protein